MIGREAFRVIREEALDHVAGYTIVNDITTRDLVFRKDMKEIGTDWYRARTRPASCRPGPFLVPAPFVDAADLSVRLELNGEVMQDASTSDLLFDIPALISARIADDAAAARRPPAHRQPGRQRPALEAVPARRRRHDRARSRASAPRSCAASRRAGRMSTPSENPADLDRTDPEARDRRARRGLPQLGPLGRGRRARHPQLHRPGQAGRGRSPRARGPRRLARRSRSTRTARRRAGAAARTPCTP